MSEADAQRYDALIKTGDVSQSAYDKARTQADTAKEQTNSARQLYEAALNSARQNFQGVINAQASLADARAQTAIARKAVDDTIIKAPFDGLYQLAADRGRPVCRADGEDRDAGARDAAQAGTAGSGIERAAVEDRRRRWKPAFPAIRAACFHGNVTAINPTVDSNSRTVSVEAKFANQDLALKPGMFATARILLNGSSTGIFLPRACRPDRSEHQLFASVLHSRRQGARGRGAIGRGGWRHGPDSIGHLAGFRGRDQPSARSVRRRAGGRSRKCRTGRRQQENSPCINSPNSA